MTKSRCMSAFYEGDLVIADGSGVVIIPQSKEQEAVREAEIVFQQEARMAEQIRKGIPIVEVLEKLGYESMLNTDKKKK